MENFVFRNPTKILFGDGMLDRLPEELAPFGRKLLLVYGTGSIKRSGLYDRVIRLLEKADKQVFELSGVMPNPRTEKVYQGIEICRRESIDFILAVGGGSVLDCSKAIAAGTLHEGDFWEDLYLGRQCIDCAVPIGAVLTMPATGSEMNSGTVISDWENNQKRGYGDENLFPQFSILEPGLTMTMPREQVVYGAVDMISHVFEQYFSPPDDDNLSDELAEAVLRNIRVNLERSLADLSDYRARSNLMWDATIALNGLLSLGKREDWQSHQIEHALSAWYDIPHGAGLAIVHPKLLYYIRKEAEHKLARYAVRVWEIDPAGKSREELALAGIRATRDFFNSIGAPANLADVGIPAEAIDQLAGSTSLIKSGYRSLDRHDVTEILKLPF
ncbi:MAG TPA: iron-containing alcohol dehydrogenase [Bacillota bacterium]|nr:iron-containing alcohol dehydrogenase [Fastidiosipila sp.]HPX93432.1 iron-containing alcohol dehydrogenase [Bacillota bacterium]HQB81204.1 iron-containing alcohol dehydrogenase [Bacillota bacterium]